MSTTTDIKTIPNNSTTAAERIRVVLSDGVHFLQAILASNQNAKVNDGPQGISQFSLVKVKDYISNFVQGRMYVAVPPPRQECCTWS